MPINAFCFMAGMLLLPLVGCMEIETGESVSETTITAPNNDPWFGHTQGLPFEFGFLHGIEQAQEQQKPVMFFVTNLRCGWCKKLATESFTDANIKSLLEHFVLIIVDSDDTREHPVLSKLGVHAFPFILFKSHEGETLAVSEGYKPKDEFEDIVVQALNAAKHNDAKDKSNKETSSVPVVK